MELDSLQAKRPSCQPNTIKADNDKTQGGSKDYYQNKHGDRLNSLSFNHRHRAVIPPARWSCNRSGLAVSLFVCVYKISQKVMNGF